LASEVEEVGLRPKINDQLKSFVAGMEPLTEIETCKTKGSGHNSQENL